MGNRQSSRIRTLQRELTDAQKAVKVEKEINKSIGLGLKVEHQAYSLMQGRLEDAKKDLVKKNDEIKDLKKEVDIRRELQLHFEQENAVLKLEIARLEDKMECNDKLAKASDEGGEDSGDADNEDSKSMVYYNMKREMEAEEKERKKEE